MQFVLFVQQSLSWTGLSQITLLDYSWLAWLEVEIVESNCSGSEESQAYEGVGQEGGVDLEGDILITLHWQSETEIFLLLTVSAGGS